VIKHAHTWAAAPLTTRQHHSGRRWPRTLLHVGHGRYGLMPRSQTRNGRGSRATWLTSREHRSRHLSTQSLVSSKPDFSTAFGRCLATFREQRYQRPHLVHSSNWACDAAVTQQPLRATANLRANVWAYVGDCSGKAKLPGTTASPKTAAGARTPRAVLAQTPSPLITVWAHLKMKMAPSHRSSAAGKLAGQALRAGVARPHLQSRGTATRHPAINHLAARLQPPQHHGLHDDGPAVVDRDLTTHHDRAQSRGINKPVTALGYAC
jgi:hypothetical protein